VINPILENKKSYYIIVNKTFLNNYNKKITLIKMS